MNSFNYFLFCQAKPYFLQQNHPTLLLQYKKMIFLYESLFVNINKSEFKGLIVSEREIIFRSSGMFQIHIFLIFYLH